MTEGLSTESWLARHFSLKCLCQARKVSINVCVCIDVASLYNFLLVLELGTVVCFVVHKILLEYKSNIFIGFRFIVYTKRHRAPLKRYTTVLYIDLSIILPVSSNNPALQYSILL